MKYIQFDKDNKEISHQDLQAKKQWCGDGERIEEAFVRKYGNELDLIINPEKEQNPYAPDLLYQLSEIADLKTQNTPFFKANDLYGIDPTFAVVFNRKDAVRYYRKYKSIIIYFWVEWHSVRFLMNDYERKVNYMNCVYKIPFIDSLEILKNAPEHFYLQRKNDTKGNSKSSFVLDIRNELFEKVI